jgi:hypothetical protein
VRVDLPQQSAAAEPEPAAAKTASEHACRLDAESVEPIWKQALERLSGVTADCAACATKLSVDGQGRLVASFPESQKFSRDSCLRPVNLSRIEAALSDVCGGRIGLVLTTHHEPSEAGNSSAAAGSRKPMRQPSVDVAADPFVQRAVELFDGDSSRLRFAAPSDEAK